MKRLILLCLLMLAGITLLRAKHRTNTDNGSSTPTTARNTGMPTPIQAQPTITSNGTLYTYAVFQVKNPEKLTLIANPEGKHSFQELVKQNSCKSAINAGFYDTEGKPLGLFKTRDAIIHEQTSSALLDGYIWTDRVGGIGIGTHIPSQALSIALQNGPLLITNGENHTLTIKNDESARRSFAGIALDNTLWFGIITVPDNTFSGPLLADLPTVIRDIGTHLDIAWISAINLDGGSASAYESDMHSVSELTPVGGIFCYN